MLVVRSQSNCHIVSNMEGPEATRELCQRPLVDDVCHCLNPRHRDRKDCPGQPIREGSLHTDPDQCGSDWIRPNLSASGQNQVDEPKGRRWGSCSRRLGLSSLPASWKWLGNFLLARLATPDAWMEGELSGGGGGGAENVFINYDGRFAWVWDLLDYPGHCLLTADVGRSDVAEDRKPRQWSGSQGTRDCPHESHLAGHQPDRRGNCGTRPEHSTYLQYYTVHSTVHSIIQCAFCTLTSSCFAIVIFQYFAILDVL